MSVYGEKNTAKYAGKNNSGATSSETHFKAKQKMREEIGIGKAQNKIK